MIKRGISLLAVLACCCSGAAAQQSNDTSSVNEDNEKKVAFPLPNVIVIGERKSAPPSIIVRETNEVDFADWNVRTAAGALARTPGVSVQVGGSSGDASPWIRGFRDRDILILFDGIPIGSALEGSLDLNEISINSVSRTRVMKGAPSVIYGANGLGGVIDVIPRSAERFDSQSLAVELAGDGGQSYRGHLGNGSGPVKYFVSAGYEAADEYSLSEEFEPQPSQATGKRINSDFERITTTLLLNADQSPIGDTSLFLNFSDVERGLTPRSTSDDPDFERLTKSQRTTVGLTNHFESLPLSLKVYYNQYDTELTVYTDSSYDTVDEIEQGEDYTFGLAAYGHLPTWKSGTLVLSGSWAQDVYQAENVFEDFDRAELNTLTLSAEHQTVLADRLSLAFGVIYTHVDQPAVDRGISEVSPQIALGLQISEKLSAHASLAQRTRFPKLREFYRRRWGNPDLVAQSADNYDLGVTYAHGPRTSTDLTFFHSRTEGLIDRPTRTSTYQNLDAVNADGLEFSSGGWLTDRTHIRLSYALVDMVESLPDGSERQLRSRAKHSAFADLRFRLSDAWQVSLNGQYVADLYDLDDDQVHTRLPSIFIIDAKSTLRLSDRLSTYLAVSNVTDENYYFRIGDPRPGRTFRIGFTFDRHTR